MSHTFAVPVQVPGVSRAAPASSFVNKEPAGSEQKQEPASKESTPAQPTKSKRVRSGCLTCRDRHLKCDEVRPECHNCRKSNRGCHWGIRLNFLEHSCNNPPVLVPPVPGWRVAFQDESRNIASEYQGGLARYRPYSPEERSSNVEGAANTYAHAYASQALNYHQQQPHPQPQPTRYQQHTPDDSSSSAGTAAPDMPTDYELDAFRSPDSHVRISPMPSQHRTNPTSRDYLHNQEEVLFMQVYVEEVGLWMDSMDSRKHVGQSLSYEPRHLSLSLLRNSST